MGEEKEAEEEAAVSTTTPHSESIGRRRGGGGAAAVSTTTPRVRASGSIIRGTEGVTERVTEWATEGVTEATEAEARRTYIYQDDGVTLIHVLNSRENRRGGQTNRELPG